MADLDVIRAVWSAQQQHDLEALDSIISETCEELLKSPSNPSRYHYLCCFYISKKLPEAFGLPKTFKVIFPRSLSGFIYLFIYFYVIFALNHVEFVL